MPVRSKAQWRLMQWLEHGKGSPAGKGKFKGLSKAKAKEFIEATPSYGSLPEHKTGKR